MNNLVNDSIGYFGSVKVTYKLNDKTKTIDITNSGTDYLFKSIVDHLIDGPYTLSGTSFPKVAYITLEDSDSLDEGKRENDMLYDYLNISPASVKVYGDFTHTLRITTTLVKSYLTNNCLDKIHSGYDDFYLKLISDTGRYLAYIKFPLSVLEAIETGIQALIQWDLTFTNKVEKY